MPSPKNTLELWLLSQASTKAWPECLIDKIWYADSDFQYIEGALLRTAMQVYPYQYHDKIDVHIYHEYVKDPKIFGPKHVEYTTTRDYVYKKTYTFDEFKNSPFWELTINAWSTPKNIDTSSLEKDYAEAENGRGHLVTHYFKSYNDWLGNNRLSGDIGSIETYTDEYGNITLIVDGVTVYDGDANELSEKLNRQKRIENMIDQLKEIDGIKIKDSKITIDL